MTVESKRFGPFTILADNSRCILQVRALFISRNAGKVTRSSERAGPKRITSVIRQNVIASSWNDLRCRRVVQCRMRNHDAGSRTSSLIRQNVAKRLASVLSFQSIATNLQIVPAHVALVVCRIISVSVIRRDTNSTVEILCEFKQSGFRVAVHCPG